MVIVISSFAVIFLLIVSGGLLLFYRQAAVQRVSSVVTQSESRGSLLSGIERTKFSASDAVSFLGRAMPSNPTETSVIQERLVRAGYTQFDSCHPTVSRKQDFDPPRSHFAGTSDWFCELQPIFRLCRSNWPWISDSGFLAGKENIGSPTADTPGPSGCAGFSRNLHRSRPKHGSGHRANC